MVGCQPKRERHDGIRVLQGFKEFSVQGSVKGFSFEFYLQVLGLCDCGLVRFAQAEQQRYSFASMHQHRKT